ncbi:MAG: cytochrome c biogenesis protein CcsA, partial [Gemmataceae bacterium]|nr:cytochrome c biogenesis protein CcsA [Gemmataceae bacterium]
TEYLTLGATVILGGAVAARVLATRRPPYANLWEYFLVLSFLILALSLAFGRRPGARALSAVTLPLVATLLVTAALFLPSRVEPLMPALQNNRLLAIHVLSMLLAYGAMGVAFAGAVVYLVQERGARHWLPAAEIAEEIEHRAIMLGFPLLGLGIALGAYWGNYAWGRYWGWDPKETTALASWLVYAAYMHARALSNWRGRRTALLAILGFGIILFNVFAVNFVISGLHSYAG